MGDVIPMRREQQIERTRELDAAEKRALSDPSAVDEYTPLLDLDRLADLRRQMEDEEAPAGQEVAAKVVAVLVARTKMPGKDVIADPASFVAGLPEMLADQPAKTLWAAVRNVRVLSDYLPGANTILKICEEERRPRRQMLLSIEASEKQHHRRREAAERQAQRDAEKERDRERFRELGVQAINLLGAEALRPDDVELASGIRPTGMGIRAGRPVSWRLALPRGETWAADFCRKLALVARLSRAHGQGRVSNGQAIAIANLIAGEEATAAREIEGIERREASHPVIEAPLELQHAVRAIEAACGFDVGHDCGDPVEKNLRHLTGLAGLADVRAIIEQQFQEEWNQRHPLIAD